jgi:type IV secretion system protein VirD4
MINTKSEGTGGDAFFEDSAAILLTALVSYVCTETVRPEERNFNLVLDLLGSIELREEPDFKNAVDTLMLQIEERCKEKQQPVPFCVKQYKKFQQAGYKTGQSILATVNAHVATLELDEVRNLLSKDELALDTLGDKLTALYIVTSDTDSTFNFLAAILYTQMFDLLCEKAKNSPKGRLPIHVRCILDEFSNLGKIPNFEVLISTIRSREISVAPILQTKSQLKARYRDHSETVVGNCDSFLFLGGKEESTIKDISEMLGRETIDSRNTSENSGRDKSYGQSFQRMGRELLSKDEIASMDGGKCIVQIKGCRPFFSKKFDLTKHENYKYLSDSNPKNEFDPKKYLKSFGRVQAKKDELVEVFEVG